MSESCLLMQGNMFGSCHMREQHPVTLVAGHMAVSAWAYADYQPSSSPHQPTQLNTVSCILAGAHWHC